MSSSTTNLPVYDLRDRRVMGFLSFYLTPSSTTYSTDSSLSLYINGKRRWKTSLLRETSTRLALHWQGVPSNTSDAAWPINIASSRQHLVWFWDVLVMEEVVWYVEALLYRSCPKRGNRPRLGMMDANNITPICSSERTLMSCLAASRKIFMILSRGNAVPARVFSRQMIRVGAV